MVTPLNRDEEQFINYEAANAAACAIIDETREDANCVTGAELTW